MIGLLSLIQEYLRLKAVVLNAQLNEQIILKQIETKLDISKAVRSERYIHYQLFVEGVERPEQESRRQRSIKCRIDFLFMIANKNYTIYEVKFNRYIYNLERLLYSDIEPKLPYSDRDISDTLTVIGIDEVQITNADRFEDDYYKPSIEFTLKVYDNTNIISQNIISQAV